MLTTGHTCAAPGDGAEPGEQPGKRPNRSATETGSERHGGKRKRDMKKGERVKKGSTERAMKPLSYTSRNSKHSNTSNNNNRRRNSSDSGFVTNEIVFQPLHPETGALLHNERTIAVLDEPCGCGDVVDVSA